VYEITVLEEYVNVKDLTGVITVTLGVTVKAVTLSLTNTEEGTYVWSHTAEEFPRMLGQLYRVAIKIFSNRKHPWRAAWP
jgi:hypothetical protein